MTPQPASDDMIASILVNGIQRGQVTFLTENGTYIGGVSPEELDEAIAAARKASWCGLYYPAALPAAKLKAMTADHPQGAAALVIELCKQWAYWADIDPHRAGLHLRSARMIWLGV